MFDITDTINGRYLLWHSITYTLTEMKKRGIYRKFSKWELLREEAEEVPNKQPCQRELECW